MLQKARTRRKIQASYSEEEANIVCADLIKISWMVGMPLFISSVTWNKLTDGIGMTSVFMRCVICMERLVNSFPATSNTKPKMLFLVI